MHCEVNGFSFGLISATGDGTFIYSYVMLAHSQYLSIFFISGGMESILDKSAARSFGYVAELRVIFEVLNLYPWFPLSIHRRRGSINIIKR